MTYEVPVGLIDQVIPEIIERLAPLQIKAQLQYVLARYEGFTAVSCLTA